MPSPTIFNQPLHLNALRCVIKRTEEKGRGVYGLSELMVYEVNSS